MKTIEYYNSRITTLKATIRRLTAEKRITILRERERTLKSQTRRRTTRHQDRWYRDRTIQAVIMAVITVTGWFVTPYINKQVNLPQKNDSRPTLTKMKVNQTIEVITYGPNSPVSIYIAPKPSRGKNHVYEWAMQESNLRPAD